MLCGNEQVSAALRLVNLRIVGWYHSHPTFRPDPSIRDVISHHQYQHSPKDSTAKHEPFIGVIVSPYNARCVAGSCYRLCDRCVNACVTDAAVVLLQELVRLVVVVGVQHKRDGVSHAAARAVRALPAPLLFVLHGAVARQRFGLRTADLGWCRRRRSQRYHRS